MSNYECCLLLTISPTYEWWQGLKKRNFFTGGWAQVVMRPLTLHHQEESKGTGMTQELQAVQELNKQKKSKWMVLSVQQTSSLEELRRQRWLKVTFSIPQSFTSTGLGSFPNQIKRLYVKLLNFSLGSAVTEAIADYTPSTSQKTSHLNPNFPEA